MRTRAIILIYLLIWSVLTAPVRVHGQDSTAQTYGPEVAAFLSLMKDEDEELEFQIRRKEISHPAYLRAKKKIVLHREAVLQIVKETGEDVVPELHIVTASEVDQIIEGGVKAIKGVKPGDTIADRWRLVEIVTRGEVFYIFERVSKF